MKTGHGSRMRSGDFWLVIRALVFCQENVSAAARMAGVHRNTIRNWLADADFQAALKEAQEKYREEMVASVARDAIRKFDARNVEPLPSAELCIPAC